MWYHETQPLSVGISNGTLNHSKRLAIYITKLAVQTPDKDGQRFISGLKSSEAKKARYRLS